MDDHARMVMEQRRMGRREKGDGYRKGLLVCERRHFTDKDLVHAQDYYIAGHKTKESEARDKGV
jgi:hypothetical protein